MTDVLGRFFNCTFTTNTSTAGHDEFIYSSGTYVDYGNCTPGRNPGPSGSNILVANGDFTGCLFPCPLGTWGRGGPTATLQEGTGCEIGCEKCPAGAVCNATALPAPNNCTVGHYNPDTGSQTAGGCRECERCALAAACRRPLPIAVRLNATRVLCAQWVFPSGDWFPPVQPVPSRHLLSDQGQHFLPVLRRGRFLRGGGCELHLCLQAVSAGHLVGHHRP